MRRASFSSRTATVSSPCALAAQQATREIPIVTVSGDPVALGLVASLARPGGNITGISLMAAELHGKCVELLHDMLPSARRVARYCQYCGCTHKLID